MSHDSRVIDAVRAALDPLARASLRLRPIASTSSKKITQACDQCVLIRALRDAVERT